MTLQKKDKGKLMSQKVTTLTTTTTTITTATTTTLMVCLHIRDTTHLTGCRKHECINHQFQRSIYRWKGRKAVLIMNGVS